MGKHKTIRSTHGLRNVLIRRDGNNCHYCHNPMSLTIRDRPPEDHTMTLEHVVPESLGGPDTVLNIVLACHKCNRERQDEVFKCDCNFCVRARNTYLNVVI